MKSFLIGLTLLVCVPLCSAEIATQCLIEPYQRIELKSPVSSQIVSVAVDRGAAVKKGQVLVALDADVELATLAVANYRSVMEGQIRSAESRVTNSRDKLKRREELRQQNFVSAQDRDDTAAELRVAEADLLEARDNRELAKLDAKRLRAVASRYTLVSPINGVVIERLQNPGELAQSSDTNNTSTAILKLAQIDPLRVEVVLPVARYGSVRVGSQVDIKPEPPFAGSYKAVVQVVDKVIDSASGTFRVRLALPNPKGDIPVGVKCAAGF